MVPAMTVPPSAILGAREPLVAVQRMPTIRIGGGMRIRTEVGAARVTATSRISRAGKHEYESGRK